MYKFIKYTFLILLMASFQPVSNVIADEEALQASDIHERLDLKTNSLLDKMLNSQSDHSDRSTIPYKISPNAIEKFKKIHGKVKTYLNQLQVNNEIPVIKKGSKLEKDMGKIYEYLLRSTVLTFDGGNVREEIANLDDKNGDLVEYIALDLAMELQLGAEIEKINPNPEQKKEILLQVAQLKDKTIKFVKSKFPDASDDDIQKAIHIHFLKYELSPDSVCQMYAKRPLSQKDFDQLIQSLDNGSLLISIDDSKYSESLGKMREFFKINDFVSLIDQIIGKSYNELIPKEFTLPKKSERLSELQNWISEIGKVE
ncbi:MAG: hypothetical protein AB1656_11645 [Candidatus Omnitrophota bacterium]